MALLTVSQICERALRKIGAYPIRGGSLRPEELAEARYWLDMMMGHQAARMRTPWLIADTAQIALVASQQDYDLRQEIGAQVVPDGLQFIVAVWLYDVDAGRDIRRISLLNRGEWEAIEDKSRTGSPECAYIDRTRWPVMRLHPVPDGAQSLRARVVYQKLASNFLNRKFSDKTYDLHECWNLWAVTELAGQLGDGPVRKLPQDEVRDMKKDAARYLHDLEAYDQFEQAAEPRQIVYWNGIN